MTVTELIEVLRTLPGDLEVLVMDRHSGDADEAAVDIGRRVPPRVPIQSFHDWAWETSNPDERFSERVVVLYSEVP